MKKVFFSFLLLSVVDFSFAQSPGILLHKKSLEKLNTTNSAATKTQSVCIKDSTIERQWGGGGTGWMNLRKHAFQYDAALNVNVDMGWTDFNSSWSPQGKTLSTYGNDHNLLYSLYLSGGSATPYFDTASDIHNTYVNNDLVTSLSRYYNSGIWENTSRNSYTYNSSHRQLSYVSEYWVNSSSTWIGNYKGTFVYTGSNLTSVNSFTWNGSLTAWVNTVRYTFTYDIFNNKIGDIYEEWDVATNSWKNVNKIILNYSGNLLSSEIYSDWNSTTNNWVNTQKNQYTYNSNNNLVTELYFLWNTSTNAWDTFYKNTITNTSAGYISTILYQYWDNTSNSFKNDDRWTYTYDGSNNQTYFLSEHNDLSNTWVNVNDQRDYYNCTTVGLKEQSSPKKDFRIYPNPAQQTLFIDSEKEITTVKIVTISGQEVLISKQNENSVSVSGLQSGIYFIELLDKSGVVLATKKFVKE